MFSLETRQTGTIYLHYFLKLPLLLLLKTPHARTSEKEKEKGRCRSLRSIHRIHMMVVPRDDVGRPGTFIYLFIVGDVNGTGDSAQ